MKNDIFSYLKEIFLRNRRMISGFIGEIICSVRDCSTVNIMTEKYEERQELPL